MNPGNGIMLTSDFRLMTIWAWPQFSGKKMTGTVRIPAAHKAKRVHIAGAFRVLDSSQGIP